MITEKEEAILRSKKWKVDNREKYLQQRQRYYQMHKDYFNKKQIEHRIKNKGQIKINNQKWNKENRDWWSKYRLDRRRNDIQYRLGEILRARLHDALKGKHRPAKTFELLGCSLGELKIHLEKGFKEGMNWNNYGLYGWHIDHKIPISFFDLTAESQVKKAFHYSNLQPLWALENLIKSDNIEIYGK